MNEYQKNMKMALSRLESAFAALRELNQEGHQYDFASDSDDTIDKVVSLANKIEKIWYQKV